MAAHPIYMDFIFEVADDLAHLLGMIFKPSKDVKNVFTLEYIGFLVHVTATEVLVRMPDHKIIAYTSSLRKLLSSDTITFRSLEVIAG